MYPDSPRTTAFTLICLGLLIVLQLLSLCRPTLQASLSSASDYYWAGVVEFRPSMSGDTVDRLADNLGGYLEILNLKEVQDLDIIAFPESTLNNNHELTFVPDPEINQTAPCDFPTNSLYHDLLVQISCAARRTNTYILINIKEKENCSSTPSRCSTNGLNIYNTNVVFNRNGAVISRYRKVHLFHEPVNTTVVPGFGMFDTDFGVRFGHFICFDILFYSPAQELVERLGIRHFIFPTMWFSQLPFLTAVQAHSSWAYANNVVLLTAGASNPSVGSTGTGIYNGQYNQIAARMTTSGDGERQLYIGRVPKDRQMQQHFIDDESSEEPFTSPSSLSPSPPKRIHLLRDRLHNYQTEEIDLLAKNQSIDRKLCFRNGEFCCYFSLEWRLNTITKHNISENSSSSSSSSRNYHYRMGVFDGIRDEAKNIDSNYIKNCAVFACTNQSINSCGTVFQDTFDSTVNVEWKLLTIAAIYPKADHLLLMPNSLTNGDLLPLKASQFDWRSNLINDHFETRLSLQSPVSDLLTFAIYGNYYDTTFRSSGATNQFGVFLPLIYCLPAIFTYYMRTLGAF